MRRRVVITGIGAVSPNGVGLENFWCATRRGLSGVKPISLFDASALPVRVAGEVRGLDVERYVRPKDRPHVSRVVPLALAAAEEALAAAGIEPARLGRDERRRIAVIVGSGGGAQDFTEQQYRFYYTGQHKQVSVYTIPSSTIGTLASEVSMRFGFRGPSHLLSTGCTSSSDALGYAFRQIRYGDSEVILAGGADAPICYLVLRSFILMRILTQRWNHAPERASRPFSADRDGFVLGECAWFFVLEPLERARARGATVYGEIAGYGSTCEAYHRVRLEECGEEPARAMSIALEDAALPPSEIQYVNLHGTGTELNDPIETRAVRLCFNSSADRLAGSALKSLIGHPQGACGAAGVAATLLAMRDGILPPTINLDVPDPACDLDYVPDVGRRAAIGAAVVNCIGFGSKNSALVLRRVE